MFTLLIFFIFYGSRKKLSGFKKMLMLNILLYLYRYIEATSFT